MHGQLGFNNTLFTTIQTSTKSLMSLRSMAKRMLNEYSHLSCVSDLLPNSNSLEKLTIPASLVFCLLNTFDEGI